jgi:transmembrane sensor
MKRGQSRADEAAMQWVVRMHSDQRTAEDEAAFVAWLALDQANRDAYDEQIALWASVSSLRHDSATLASIKSLRRDVDMERRGLLTASAASVAGVMAVGGAGWGLWNLLAPEAYATAIGEQRRIVLADGSAVTLNTNSVLRVRFDGAQRRTWLDRGQAFFDVAKDPARPFRVFAGADEVRAIGTAFDVRRQGQHAHVTLEEGSVAVFRDADETKPVEAEQQPAVVLAPNEQVIVAPAKPIEINHVDTRLTGAWRFGHMVLESETLANAIDEINRYNTRRILIADPAIEKILVNGMFQTGRPEAFVEALTKGFPVDVLSEDEHAIVLVGRGVRHNR